MLMAAFRELARQLAVLRQPFLKCHFSLVPIHDCKATESAKVKLGHCQIQIWPTGLKQASTYAGAGPNSNIRGGKFRTMSVPVLEHRVLMEFSVPVENTKLAITGVCF
jgi:hypothetical protein